MNSTKDKVFDNTAIIVSDGCCVQLGNTQALDDVTFSITKGKKVAVAVSYTHLTLPTNREV